MTHVQVVYATSSGCSQEIADHIAAEFTAAGLSVSAVDVHSNPLPTGDPVLVVSGIRAEAIHATMQEWITRHAAVLADSKLAIARVGLNPKTPPATKVLTAAGVTATHDEFFLGLYDKERFYFAERMLMRAMRQKEGDFRDFAAITAWTREVIAAWGFAPASTS